MMALSRRMLLLPAVMARLKYCQVMSPDSTNSGYGNPSEGIAARRPKTHVNTSVLRSGLSTAQPIPRIACLYCTPIWRHVKTSNSSCARASSMSPVSYQGDAATMRVTGYARAGCAGDAWADREEAVASGCVCATDQGGSAAVMGLSVVRPAAPPGGQAQAPVPPQILLPPPPRSLRWYACR